MKMHKNCCHQSCYFWLRFRYAPNRLSAGASLYSAPPDPLAGLGGGAPKEREGGRGGEKEGGKGRGGSPGMSKSRVGKSNPQCFPHQHNLAVTLLSF